MTMAAPHILVVDDDPDTCASVADVLTDLGYHVDTAHDGPSALALLEEHPYHLLLLDYRMPGMNGLELYRRARDLRPGTDAVIMTALAESDEVGEAIGAGVRRVICKPVDFGAVISRIEEIIGKPYEF
jgi:CheY-like chemotaxis protein